MVKVGGKSMIRLDNVNLTKDVVIISKIPVNFFNYVKILDFIFKVFFLLKKISGLGSNFF